MKLLPIKNCRDCKYCYSKHLRIIGTLTDLPPSEDYCVYTGSIKTIDADIALNKFPTWCPLEDVEK